MEDNNSMRLNYQSDNNIFNNEKQLLLGITVKSESYFSNIHLRKERFSAPIVVSIPTPLIQDNRTLHLTDRDGRDFVTAYMRYAAHKSLIMANIVEEAALGIIEEGTKLNKSHEAEQLAEQLRFVKRLGENSRNLNSIPPQIGETCIFTYTKETFWYKLINSALSNLYMINETHLRTLGPFVYLLKKILRTNSTANIMTVYRGVNLTDEQIKQYRTTNSCFLFTSFTSTSIN